MYPSHFSGENLGFNEFSPSTKERLINLYWMQLVNKKNSKLRDEDYYDTNREHYIIEYLKAINYTQDHIRRDADHLTEKHYIDWIIDLDFRQHEFIINKLDSLNNLKKYAKYNSISCIGSGKTLITTIFDILQNNTTTRNNTIPIVIKSWDETIMHDRIFTWFETNTNERIICALNWLKRNEPAHTKHIHTNILPHNPLETIKILFDKLYQHKDTKIIQINKIKRSFTNKTYHQNSTYIKSPLYIELSEHHKNNLKEIAKSNNMSMRQLIENWIDMTLTQNRN